MATARAFAPLYRRDRPRAHPGFGLAVILIASGLPATRAGPSESGGNALTPGAVASTSEAEVCGRDAEGLSYSQAHRVWHDKAGTMRRYGLPLGDMRLYEDDDRVPVCLGGDNAAPQNHWPIRWPEARGKDRLEWAVCRMVCREHTISLDEAQRLFLAPADWRASYRRVFGSNP